jgi:hypothetical protein
MGATQETAKPVATGQDDRELVFGTDLLHLVLVARVGSSPLGVVMLDPIEADLCGELGGRIRSVFGRRAVSSFRETLGEFDERATFVFATNPKKRPHQPGSLDVEQGR